MTVGGFETLEEYYQWMNTPLDPEILEKVGQPDPIQEAFDLMAEELGLGPDDEELDDEEWEDNDKDDDAALEHD